MSTSKTLDITLSGASSDSDAELSIVQKEYGETDGLMSRAGLYLALIALLNDEEVEEDECTEEITAVLYVYRTDLSIPYQLKVSHGTLGAKLTETVYETQLIKPQLEDEKDLDLPCFGIEEVEWLGDCAWNSNGEKIDPPAISWDRTTISFDQAVYGTCAIAQKCIRDKYTLTLPLRDDCEENALSCIAFALWTGGPTWIEVDPPEGAEDSGEQCSGGYGSSTDTDDDDNDDDPPVAPNADAKVVTDYCSQEITSDSRE